MEIEAISSAHCKEGETDFEHLRLWAEREATWQVACDRFVRQIQQILDRQDSHWSWTDRDINVAYPEVKK